MTPHDPYLTQTIDAIGRERTIIALQRSAAYAYKTLSMYREADTFGFLMFGAEFQHSQAWYSRQARILMGIE